MNKSDFRKLLLADTVSIPSADGQVAKLTAVNLGTGADPQIFVRAETEVSAKLSIVRTFAIEDVRAVYVPAYKEWCESQEQLNKVAKDLIEHADAECNAPPEGIVYVREDAPTLLELKAGMTAGESLEFYDFFDEPTLESDAKTISDPTKPPGDNDPYDDKPGPSTDPPPPPPPGG